MERKSNDKKTAVRESKVDMIFEENDRIKKDGTEQFGIFLDELNSNIRKASAVNKQKNEITLLETSLSLTSTISILLGMAISAIIFLIYKYVPEKDIKNFMDKIFDLSGLNKIMSFVYR